MAALLYWCMGFQLLTRAFWNSGFAGNDSPSFVFPTAIATKAQAGGAGGSGSGRPAVANKPSFLTGGAGPGGHLHGKRGTEDLDFFIGDEAIAASNGPGWFLSVSRYRHAEPG
jgi:actin-related protein 3